jgi:transposase
MRFDVATPVPARLKFTWPTIEPVVLPAPLPNDIAALKALLQSQHQCHALAIEQAVAATQAQAHRHIEYLYEQIVLFRHRMFGASTEQSVGQARLFDEAEVLAAGPDPEAQEDDEAAPIANALASAVVAPALSSPPKARGKRAPLPAELPRVDIVHEIHASERLCACGTPMVEIGEEISEQLDVVPMKIQVLRHIRKRYGCADASEAPVTAALPAQPLPKSNASPDLLAMLLTVKYADGLPLARFEKVLQRSGVSVPRQTLARWTIGSAGVLQPLHNLARDALFDGPYVHMDETEVQVLKEPGRAASARSYMWVQAGGPADKPVVIYDYQASRHGDVPVALLDGYQGYLMTDGYGGYNALAKAKGIEHLACLAHVRRYFVDAARVQAKGKRGRADEAIEMIRDLYKVERDCRDASDAVRLAARHERSLPVLGKLKDWLDKTLPVVSPQSALGKALGYLAEYWSRLVRYTERGDLPIGRVEMWRGGRRSGLSVAAPFVSRCPSNLTVAPFPHPPRRTGRADRPHPALFRRIKPSRSSGRVQAAAGVSAPTSRRGTGRSIGGTPFPACRYAVAARSADAVRCSRPSAGRCFRPALG